MSDHLTDEQISQLLTELKELPNDYMQRLALKPRKGHSERNYEIQGAGGNRFHLILRQNDHNPLDFSAILAYSPPNSNRLLNLRRYNGVGHPHRNRIEETRCDFTFHIHQATHRYQEIGRDIDAYAERTNRFASVWQALECLIEDCGLVRPDDPQTTFGFFRKEADDD
jgi:hypothetical protein